MSIAAAATGEETSGLSDSRIALGRLADSVCRQAVGGGADSVCRRAVAAGTIRVPWTHWSGFSLMTATMLLLHRCFL